MTEMPNEIEDVTRICIKNLPPNFTESKLRSHLISNSQIQLVITDCKILRTKEGVSRKIGFVGFKTSEMATYAISYFDKSFAATSRLSVEAAFSKFNQSDYRPWSKHSKVSSKFETTTHGGERSDETLIASKDTKKQTDGDQVDSEVERKKQEFIDVMLGGKKTSSNLFWANDDGLGKAEKSLPVTKEGDIGGGTANASKSDEGSTESDSSDEDSSDSDSDDDSVDILKTDNQNVSDMDFLRSKVVDDKDNFSDHDDDDGDGEEITKSMENENDAKSSTVNNDDQSSSDSSDTLSGPMKDSSGDIDAESEGQRDVSVQNLVTNARLFIRNLPFSATEEEIKDSFSGYGNIIECHIPVDDTNRNKGYAFIKFSSNDEASNALRNLDGTPFQGRLMHILPAKEEHNASQKSNDGDMDKNLTHKQRKELERQKDAGNMKGWNASFIRGDAVVDNLASRLGIEKGSILNVKDDLTAGNAAVRLALGETQVIEENRAYFQKHGIDIDGLVSSSSDAPSKRSSNMILAKNLPFDTSLEELSKVFIAVNGKRPQVLLPPSKTVALIIFPNNSDAKKAFRKLAYKRFKNVPLYLEWASVSMTPTNNAALQEESTTNNKILEENIGKEEELVDEDEFYSIYIKNLNFRTTEETLRSVFEEEVGRVRSVRIPTKASAVKAVRGIKPQSDEEPFRQSMGFGFVEFNSKADAKKALSSLQGKIIDGHEIEISMSKSKSTPSSKLSGEIKKPSTKIIVRNVPFQASRTEILQLFGSFGHLKTVRLPKKYDGGHRGFAFVEFSSSQEALNAMKSLASTHLYGRHLVLEWASESNDIESLRDKTKRDSEASGILSVSSNKKNRTK